MESIGVYKVPYSLGEAYQVCWEGASSCEEGKGILWLWGRIYPSILMLFGRISNGEKEKGTEVLGKKIRFKKLGVGKNIKL